MTFQLPDTEHLDMRMKHVVSSTINSSFLVANPKGPQQLAIKHFALTFTRQLLAIFRYFFIVFEN